MRSKLRMTADYNKRLKAAQEELKALQYKLDEELESLKSTIPTEDQKSEDG